MLDDLSFEALKACKELNSLGSIEEIRVATAQLMANLTEASTCLLLGFDQSGSSIIPLAGQEGLHIKPIDITGTSWSDSPLNYLFSSQKCLWESNTNGVMINARSLLFGMEAFGRLLVVPARTKGQGYADVVYALLVPTNIRPTWRTFSILSVYANASLALMNATLGRPEPAKNLSAFASQEQTKKAAKNSKYPYWDKIIGRSSAIVDMRAQIENYAPSSLNILVTGETGTGKELVARALHEHSLCRNGPFIAINTTVLPSQLIESEIFGHVKGAFTGANENRIGLIAKANGGTLFLDEIGDLPFELQAKLLRVLQDRRYRPVGGDKELVSDFRLITATHRNLEMMIEKETFRQDLYYRINQANIHIPPVRERGQDILLLAEHFLEEYAIRMGQETKILQPEARRHLMDMAYPGNVRELMAMVSRAAASASSSMFIHVNDILSKGAPETAPVTLPSGVALPEACADFERIIIQNTFNANNKNRKATAEKLKIPLRTLVHKLDRYGIE